MKHRVNPFFAIALCALFLFSPGFSKTVKAAELPAKTITVHGTGTVSVDPDQATIRLGVSTNGTAAEEVKNQNAAQIKKIRAKLKELAVPDTAIVTTEYQIYPQYSYEEKGSRTLTGYEATHMLSIKTEDVTNASLLMDACIAAGANENRGIAFSLSNPEKYYGDALKLSVKNAEVSAQYISEAIKKPLKEMQTIQEETNGYSYTTYSMDSAAESMMRSADGANTSTNIGYEKIKISAQVSITYTY